MLALRLVLLLSCVGLAGCRASGPPAPAPTATAVAVPTHAPALRSTSTVPVPTEVLAPAQAAKQALKAPLRLAFVAGVARRYTLSLRTTLQAPGQQVPASGASLNVEYEVLSVQPDGNASVRATVDSGDWSGTVLRVRLASDGSYADPRLEQGMGDADGVARSLMLFPYLNGPLYIGDSFDKRLRFSPGPSLPDTTVAVRYTLAGLTQQDGRDLARIDAAGSLSGMTIPAAGGVEFSNARAQVKGSDLVSTDDGWPTSGESSMILALDATSKDGSVKGTVTARVEQSYRLEHTARGISV